MKPLPNGGKGVRKDVSREYVAEIIILATTFKGKE